MTGMGTIRAHLPLAGVAVALALLCWALWLRGDLSAARSDLTVESAAHNATRHELATERTANNLLLADQRSSNATIIALTRQVNATQALHREYVASEAKRRAMLDQATTRTRTPDETAQVVDNATRRAAADLLNAW